MWTLLGIVIPALLEFIAKMLKRNSFKPLKETVTRDNMRTEIENLKYEVRLMREELKERNGK